MTNTGRKVGPRSALSRLIGHWIDHPDVSTDDIRLARPRPDLGPALPHKLIRITVPFLQRMKPEDRNAILDLDPRWNDAFEIWGGPRVAAPLAKTSPRGSQEVVSAP